VFLLLCERIIALNFDAGVTALLAIRGFSGWGLNQNSDLLALLLLLLSPGVSLSSKREGRDFVRRRRGGGLKAVGERHLDMVESGTFDVRLLLPDEKVATFTGMVAGDFSSRPSST